MIPELAGNILVAGDGLIIPLDVFLYFAHKRVFGGTISPVVEDIQKANL